MAAKSPARRRIAGQVGIISRWHGPDDPRLPVLREALDEARVAEEKAAAETAVDRFIDAIVGAAPSLTAEQKTRLAPLLDEPAIRGAAHAA